MLHIPAPSSYSASGTTDLGLGSPYGDHPTSVVSEQVP